MKRYPARHGFTLLEVIATLLLISVAGVTVVTYMRAGLDRSANAPLNLRSVYDLSAEMANIEAARNGMSLADFQVVLDDMEIVGMTIQHEIGRFTADPPFEWEVNVNGALLRVILEDGEGRRLVTLFGP